MNETQWTNSVRKLVNSKVVERDSSLSLRQGARIAYASEILSYKDKSPAEQKEVDYETDLLVVEHSGDDSWKPRVAIECKTRSVTTHDAITYSEKAFTHKRVHPYLRYGILLGSRAHHPLPGRLFRHGIYFDFMLSWTAESPTDKELDDLMDVLIDEVTASRSLEEILYNSRSATRNRYVVFHKPLRLKK